MGRQIEAVNALNDGAQRRPVVDFERGAIEKELPGFGQAGQFVEAFDGVADGVESRRRSSVTKLPQANLRPVRRRRCACISCPASRAVRLSPKAAAEKADRKSARWNPSGCSRRPPKGCPSTDRPSAEGRRRRSSVPLARFELVAMSSYLRSCEQLDWRTRIDWRRASKTSSRVRRTAPALKAAEPVELARVEERHIAGHESLQRCGSSATSCVVGVSHFCSLYRRLKRAAMESTVSRNDLLFGRQRLFADGVVHEGRRWRRHAVGEDELVRRIEHLRPVKETLVHDGLDRVVVLVFDGRASISASRSVELLHVALEGAAEGHHIHFLAVRPDDSMTSSADERVRAFPDGNLACGLGRCRGGRSGPSSGSSPGSPLARRLGLRLLFSRGQLERQRVVVFLLEIFGDRAEIEQEEVLLFVFGVADVEGVTGACRGP